jgi:phosphatidylinositol glycan class H protein
MVSLSVSNKRYTYIHESGSKSTREAIDIHHVIINGSSGTGYARRWGLGFFLVFLASSMYFLLGKDNPARTLSWGCLLSGFLVMLHSRKFVKKGEILVHPDTRFTGLPNDISFTF